MFADNYVRKEECEKAEISPTLMRDVKVRSNEDNGLAGSTQTCFVSWTKMEVKVSTWRI